MTQLSPPDIHPSGEVGLPEKTALSQAIEVETYAGKVHVEWGPTAAVTPVGQLAFFIEFLNRRLMGHYNYYGIIGNGHSIKRLYRWALDRMFKWLNRRGGKRRGFTGDVF